jgi:hypothetical protein
MVWLITDFTFNDKNKSQSNIFGLFKEKMLTIALITLSMAVVTVS